MAFRDCWGTDLPDNIQSVECSDIPEHLNDCCGQAAIEDEILLWERVESGKGGYYYWTIIEAGDETPVAVCDLEQYAESRNLQGRKSDYLAAGWYHGDCFILAIELRETLLNEEQINDKIEQVKQSLELVISELLPEIKTSDVLANTCSQPENYKIAGVVIPSTRSKKRAEQTRIVDIHNQKVVIAALPSSRIKACRIRWPELLVSIGV